MNAKFELYDYFGYKFDIALKKIWLPQSVVANTITLTVIEVVSGNSDFDMCIGEIEVF